MYPLAIDTVVNIKVMLKFLKNPGSGISNKGMTRYRHVKNASNIPEN